METTERIIPVLPLIVLGNGFDIHCKLKSRYIDYFNSCNTTKYGPINSWYDLNIASLSTEIVKGSNEAGSLDELVSKKKISVWDVFFCLLSHYSKLLGKPIENVMWFNVEEMIKGILYQPNHSDELSDYETSVNKLLSADKIYGRIYYNDPYPLTHCEALVYSLITKKESEKMISILFFWMSSKNMNWILENTLETSTKR